MWPYPWTHVGTPSHLRHMDRSAATMPSQAHAGAAQEAPDIGQWEGQDVPLVRPSSCNVKGGIPSSRRYLPTYLPRHAKTVAYHSRSNGRAEVAGRQMFEKFRQLHIDEPGRNWYNSLWRVLQAYHDLPGPTGLSPHRILFLRDRVSRTLSWLNHGKVARDANAMMAEADDTAAKVCKALQDEHDKRAKYFKQGKVQKYALQDTVWVERHHKDVLSRHRQASWYVPGVIVRKVGQDMYAVRVGDNKILDRDHTQLRPRAPDPSERPVTFKFRAGDVDSDNEGEDDDFTAEKILADKPDPGTPGSRLYKVRWKGFAASRDSWEPPSSFVPRYTTVWMDYLKKKNISLDVKDVFVAAFGGCSSTVMDSPWHFCLFLCLGDG